MIHLFEAPQDIFEKIFTEKEKLLKKNMEKLKPDIKKKEHHFLTAWLI